MSAASELAQPDPRGIRAFSAGARAAGAVLAMGYLLGAVAGPVAAVIGALALLTLGRVVRGKGEEAPLAAAALALIAGALGIAALRWGSLDLETLRGAQAVLGPTVLVGPGAAAGAAWLGAGAGVLALAVWAGVPPRPGRPWAWGSIEVALGALALVTGFYGEKLEPLTAAGVARWAAATVGVALVAAAAGRWLSSRSVPARAGVLGVAAAALAVGAVLLAVGLR